MFRRRTTDAAPPAPEPVVEIPGAEASKGRPTPKRRDAEAQRAARVKPPKDRREAAKMQRDRARTERSRTREALVSGDERYLPARDKGPVRRFVRDTIDARRTVGEFFIVIGFAVVIMSLVPNLQLQLFAQSAFLALFVLLLAEGTFLGFRLRRALDREFPPAYGPHEGRRGAVLYGIMRAFQLRRLRLPKPKVGPGSKVDPGAKA